MTPVAAKAATCTENGNKAYYVCSGCSKWFEDATGNVEITDHDSVVLTALGHEYTEKVMDDAHKKDTAADCRNHDTYWYDCTRGDHNAKDDPAASDKWYESTNAGSHSYDESAWGYKGADGHAHKCRYDDTHDTPVAHTPGAAATETTPQTCTVCGYKIAPATGGGSSGGGGSSVSTYAITVKDAKNGDVSANRKSAAKGTTVTLTVAPDKGYVLDTIKVLDSKDNAIKLTEKDSKFTFIMPGSKVTVEATFKAETPDNPFTDVPEGSYYEDAVIWAVDKGVTGGTSATTFSPDGICTRAQAVTFLWRAAGSPAPKSSAMPFTDVKAGSYYYDAVLWAVEQGITAGTSATTFAPDLNCSRAQIVTFLYRAAGSPAVSGSPAFSDVASDAYYAKAVKWAQANGITSGIGGGLFGSNDNCTRAQIVTFIYRYMEK